MKKAKNDWVSSLRKSALSLSIIIMMNLFFNTGLAVFNPKVDYAIFCPDEMWNDQSVCESVGGEWIEEGADTPGYCLEGKSCWEQQEEANEPIEQLNFFVLVGLGVLSLTLGLWKILPSAVANGLMYGGVISMLVGWIRAAQYLDQLAHFVISGIFLILLVALGVKKLKD